MPLLINTDIAFGVPDCYFNYPFPAPFAFQRKDVLKIGSIM